MEGSGSSGQRIIHIILLFFFYIQVEGGTSLLLPGRIIGGEDASIKDFPYQVSIHADNQHQCGGAIINEKFILTAAHCFTGIRLEDLKVVVGITELNETGRIEHDVKRVIIHESYRYTDNDIALVRVLKPIEFSDNVQPINLPTDNVTIGADIDLILTGWGHTSYPGVFSNHLQMICLKSISNEDCEKLTETSPMSVRHTNLCTLTKRGEGACHGDSGGPLVHENSIFGIVSWGKPCGLGFPDIYTRVEKYVVWIKNNLHW